MPGWWERKDIKELQSEYQKQNSGVAVTQLSVKEAAKSSSYEGKE